jgi:hypothetical protein
VVVAIVVASLWCLTTGRTSAEAWRVPVDYSADAWYTLAVLRAAEDGHVSPFGRIVVPELGAPLGASWNDFLRQHKPQYWVAGLLARALGLFPAANLLVLSAAVLAALSFLAVARYLRARAEWAFTGACAFALSPFFFHRSLSHLTLAFYWPIPLAILVVAWASGRRGVVFGERRLWLASAIAVVAGFHNIYFSAIFAQLLGFAALAQWLVRRRPRAALGATFVLAVLFVAVVADNANLLLQHASQGPASAILRPYGNLERYALKPIELVLPVGDGAIVPWRAAGGSYLRLALVRGEMGAAYLGLAGVASLVSLAVVSACLALTRPPRAVPATALAVAWILAYAVVGGVNGLVGLSGFVWLRAASRSSIFILGLVLLWATLRVSRSAQGRMRPWSVLAAAAVATLTLADQLPRRTGVGALRETAGRVAADLSFVRTIEAVLPAGSMLFQLPIVDFPEGQRTLGALDYEHLRPYLHARRLRFSYGSDKGRAREAWQHRVEALEPKAMAGALEGIGFAGIIVNQKAYPDRGRALREALAALGRVEAWESLDRDFLFVRLHPAPHPERPEDILRTLPTTQAAQSDEEAAER